MSKYFTFLKITLFSYFIILSFSANAQADALVVSLACPATPGSDGMITETTNFVTAPGFPAVTQGTITFPAGYAGIPANAINVNVSLTTTIETLSASQLSHVVINIDAPGTFADNPAYQPSSTSGQGLETYTIDYGDNDPTGDWVFTVTETTNDPGVDAQVTFLVTLTWTVPPTPSDCDTIVCDANSFVLDTNLPGLSYNWSTTETTQSITVTQSGVYSVTVTDGTETAIDDIVVLFGDAAFTNEVLICDGQTHTEGSSNYTMAGTYTDTYASYLGCDSVVTTILTVAPTPTTEVYPLICNGGSYTIGSSTYTMTGDYTDVLTTYLGCDSTVISHLTVVTQITETEDIDICDGESHIVGTSTYTMPGTYTDVLMSYLGCDSVVTTNLTVNDTYDIIDDVTICFGNTLMVGSNTYTTTGQYMDILTSIDGCDSLVTTNLIVLNDIITEDTLELCFGTSHTVGTSTYTMSGDYVDILTSYQGCDSTVMTNLTILPDNFNETFIQICDGQIYTVGTTTYNTAGDYTDILPDYRGCDSTILTHLSVVNEIVENVDVEICDGLSHMAGNSTYTMTGIYADTIPSSLGCDSIINTNLIVHNVYNINIDTILCFGDSIIVGTNVYNTTGSYSDLLTSINGCDSLVNVNLTMLDDIITEQSPTLCAGSIFNVGTTTYSMSGDYTDILASYQGCDSTVITHLIILDEIITTNDVQICQGQSYTEGTSTYTMDGTYTDIYPSFQSCDSTVITNLTVVSTIEVTDEVSICDGDSHTVGMSTYNSDGTYMDSFISTGGCDSIVTTILTVVFDTPTTDDITICFGDSYIIGMSSYNSAGTYTDVLTSSLGCDSTVITNLSIIGDAPVEQDVQICQGQVYSIGNSNYNNPGVYTDVLESSLGCDSVVITTLDVVGIINTTEIIELCEGETYMGNVFVESTSISNFETSISGCDSIHTINIVVSEAFEVELIIEDDVCGSESGSATASVFGGIQPYLYTWSTGSDDLFLEDLTSGTYSVTVTDDFGCTATDVATVGDTPSVDVEYTVEGVNCFGDVNGFIDITISNGVEPYIVNWSGPDNYFSTSQDINNLAAGLYTLIVYDQNGCGFGTSIEVETPDELDASIFSTPGTAIAIVDGGTAPFTYAWSNGANTPSIIDVEVGDYAVTIIDANGCASVAQGTVDFGTDIETLDNLVSFNILPNPSNGKFILDMNFSQHVDLEIQIVGISGKSVYNSSLSGTNIVKNIDISDRSAGSYFLLINDGNNRKVEQLLIVN